MPELPEVETIARTLAPQVLGRTIEKIEILAPKSLQAGHELLQEIPGALIKSVKRRAKLLLLELEGIQKTTMIVAFHLKMTGRVMVYPDEVPAGKHTKIIIHLTDANQSHEQLFFDDMRTFGYCRIMLPENLSDWKFWRELGPEPLEKSPKELATLFRTSHGRIKATLLNQQIVVGIGNIYADESLFRAGIRPDVKASSIPLAQLEKLGQCVQEILKESIEACGSSIRDYRDANGNAGAFQNTFYVYGRGGEACRSCGETLESARVAGRGTVFCPQCQK